MSTHMHFSHENSSAAHKLQIDFRNSYLRYKDLKEQTKQSLLWLCIKKLGLVVSTVQYRSHEHYWTVFVPLLSIHVILYSCWIYTRQHWHCTLCLSWGPQVSNMLSKPTQFTLPLKNLHRCLTGYLTFNSTNTHWVNDRSLYILINSSTPIHTQVSYWSFCHRDLVQLAQTQ